MSSRPRISTNPAVLAWKPQVARWPTPWWASLSWVGEQASSDGCVMTSSDRSSAMTSVPWGPDSRHLQPPVGPRLHVASSMSLRMRNAPCAPFSVHQHSLSRRISISPWSRKPRCSISRATSGTAPQPNGPSSPQRRHAVRQAARWHCPSLTGSASIATGTAFSSWWTVTWMCCSPMRWKSNPCIRPKTSTRQLRRCGVAAR